MSDDSATVKSARRIFEVLEHFDEVQRPMPLKELADKFAYPASSASVLLKSMVRLGYLDYDSYSRTYMPTMRIAQLGQWVQKGLFGESDVLNLVDYVNDKTGEMVSIGTQSDLHAQYIHVVQSRHALRFHITPGTIRPLTHSGVGWLMLSTRSDAEIDRLVRRANSSRDPAAKTTLAEVMERVNAIRRDGYIFSYNVVVKGGGVIGMVLPLRCNSRTLAIAVGGPTERLEEKKAFILSTLQEGIARYLKPT